MNGSAALVTVHETEGGSPVDPVGYQLAADGLRHILKVEADLLASEGIDPAWPGFDEGGEES